MHIRQAPYRVMWIGDYVTLESIPDFRKSISEFTREEDLLGFSTIYNREYLRDEDGDQEQEESYKQKISFIDKNNKLWNNICVWEASLKYFNWNYYKSVKYEGYLINHTKKLAVDLKKYYKKSKLHTDKLETFVVDPIPPLTETGGGIEILFFDGLSAKTTEGYATTWCGDLLQIVNELPENYTIIDCCFAEAACRYRYCYYKYGVNTEGLILDNKDLFSAVTLSIRSNKRSSPCNIKVEEGDGYIEFIPVYQ